MVFTRLALGLVSGLTIPHLVHQDIYMTIASSFLRPHLRYRIEKDKLTKDQAVSTRLLDSYIKDAIGSFFFFFIVIGPVIYYTYFMDEKKDIEKMTLEDKYTNMLVKIK